MTIFFFWYLYGKYNPKDHSKKPKILDFSSILVDKKNTIVLQNTLFSKIVVFLLRPLLQDICIVGNFGICTQY